MSKSNIALSFEVFPPHTPVGLSKLQDTCSLLNKLNPKFISVTFGAAGASQLNTVRVVKQLTQKGIKTTPHISCVGMTRARLEKLLHTYITLGIKRLVVIRGDFIPGKAVKPQFKYAVDLIKAIRNLTGNHFEIAVAVYPESENMQQDLQYFQQKVDAGADLAITQFFFDWQAYENFREHSHRLGIKIPLIPGVMPIYDFNKLIRFSAACGAIIPSWMREKILPLKFDYYAIRFQGLEIVLKLCEKLLLNEAEGLHFYTLNQQHPTLDIFKRLFQQENSF